MSVHTFQTTEWSRKHDPKSSMLDANLHSASEAADFITLLRDAAPDKKLKAVGMHWSLSDAVYSDGDYIETYWPPARNVSRDDVTGLPTDGIPRNTGLALDMQHIISEQMVEYLKNNPPARPEHWLTDPCLQDAVFLPVHLKSGTRIFQAYSLLDRTPQTNTELATHLNIKLGDTPHQGAYDGPWAFQTLGGSGGQTVFGALTTGTHGGDYLQQPLSDSVMAMHLITNNGAHFWIEPATNRHRVQLTDDAKLRAHYENLVEGVPFEIIRDDDIFNAVAVGVGRFGIVASMVLRVVPQYCLLEHRRLDTWKRVKQRLTTRDGSQSFLPAQAQFRQPHFPPDSQDDRSKFNERFGQHGSHATNRFLQIGLCLAPNGDDDHQCGITQRWFHPMVGDEAIDPDRHPRGRMERGTVATAGNSSGYKPPDDLSEVETDPSFLEKACASGNFMAGVINSVADEIEETVKNGAVPAGGAFLYTLGVGAGLVAGAVAAICAALVAAIIALRIIADHIASSGDTTMSEVFDDMFEGIMNNPLIPDEVGVMIIRTIFNKGFESEQSNRDYVALGYAVMDGHNYLDRSCNPNVESIEVFFDAAQPDLYCAYVDELLAFEKSQQEQKHKFTVGYISLRYIKQSSALIAPARYADTVVMEVSGLRAVSGSVDFVMNAADVARNPNYNASFHWGQYNPLKRNEVESHYGERLDRWRKALSKITNGNDRFSSEFTRRAGLEPN